MKIGLISDTHGDLEAWEKAIDFFNNEDCQSILHSGDILYHGVFNPIKDSYNPLELADRINNCPIPIIFAKGNCDSDVDTLAVEYPIQSPFAFYEKNGNRFLILHGDKYTEDELFDIAKKYKIKFIIRGHTHINNIIQKDGIYIINPGSVSLPKDSEGIPTIGILTSKNINIISLKDLSIIQKSSL